MDMRCLRKVRWLIGDLTRDNIKIVSEACEGLIEGCRLDYTFICELLVRWRSDREARWWALSS